MEFRQIYTPGLAHCSYVIGGKNACVVIDPARNVTQYVHMAYSLGLPIKAVIETHLHADFVSGHAELSRLTGAGIYISEKAKAEFEHKALKDGDEIQIDTLLIKMLETPGHTPESSIYLVSDLERGKEPVIAFTGDTLMVGDAGRPDLFPEIKEKLAAELYQSLRKIEELPDNIELYPAHGAGSLCGKSLSSKLSSTIGTEKMQNYAMHLHPEEEFIRSFLEGMPEVPDHFARCSEINRKGAPELHELKEKIVGYTPKEFLKRSREGYSVVDVRDGFSFGAAHVPGSYGLSILGNFATFSGWVLPPDKPILLVLDSMSHRDAVLDGLYSVGLDNIAGYLAGGIYGYAESGLETARLESISVSEARQRYEKGEIALIDTRLRGEWESGHIEGAVHIPTPDIREKYSELPADKPVAFICSTGIRSLLAGSMMLKLSGRKDVINVIGGMTAWMDRGYPVITESLKDNHLKGDR